MIGGGGAPKVGAPTISGAKVVAQLLEQKRAPKSAVFKKKRRKNFRRKLGHRQRLTAVRIMDIVMDGRSVLKKPLMPPRFKRSTGITPSEKVLADLCDDSFLSLWSYPNLYRKPGKELCDLLVVFGNDVIIFSDKSCGFHNSGDLQRDWSNWYRKTIASSARQIRGAERWIIRNADSVFLDPKCTEPLPIQLPSSDHLRIHRVCVVDGASKRSDGRATTLAVSAIVGGDMKPFTVGHIAEAQGWAHVFDAETLPVALRELSTVADFVDYLQKKEALIESGNFVRADSELDLLAYFLWNNREFPAPDQEPFKIEPDIWANIEANQQFLAAREANKVSFLWDHFIEYLNGLYIRQELETGNELPVTFYENAIRIMAGERRFSRRVLAKWILGRAEMAPNSYVGSLFPSLQPDVLYVLLVGPGSSRREHGQYRKARFEQLRNRCIAAKAAHPDRRHIIGMALDARGVKGSSEDFIYLDTDDWTQEQLRNAEELRQELDYFIEGKARESRLTESEYPAD